MGRKILVTGGAGFIGSHLVDSLLEKGHTVRIFDNLDPQIHGEEQTPPSYLNQEAEFIRGDVRDDDILRQAISGIEVIYHQAAAVGVGQSMYQISRYVDINTAGTANLLNILVNEKNSVKKLIVASSMSIYGEGAYHCTRCGDLFPTLRSVEQLEKKDWEFACPVCQEKVKSIPTSEKKPLSPTSIYAISKRDQEEMCLVIGRSYRIPTVALRYFNVYGERQALSNPYTGVAAIFSARLLNGKPPLIFEDGLQSRDFIHVSDIVQANLLALESEAADYQVFNVGTGVSISIAEVADVIMHEIGTVCQPQIVNKFREGDIRHCYADIGRIKQTLGFTPRVDFESGFKTLVAWVKTQQAEDRVEDAAKELELRGLTR